MPIQNVIRKLIRAAIFAILTSPGICFAADYKAYHAAVNNAERCLVTRQADSAMWYYDRAFAQYDFVFARDALIAAQIAWKNGKAQKTSNYLIKGAASGLRAECLGTAPILKSFLSSALYQNLRPQLISANSKFISRTDTLLAREWARRFAMEQAAKNRGVVDGSGFEAYRLVVVDNVQAIERLWQQKKVYPGDQRIGPGANCGELGNMHAFYTLAHYDCMATEHANLLWEAVRTGQLHPCDLAALYEFERLRLESVPAGKYTNSRCKADKRKIMKFNLTWFHETDKASLEEARRNRILYWLCDESVDRAKKELEHKEGYKLNFGYR